MSEKTTKSAKAKTGGSKKTSTKGAMINKGSVLIEPRITEKAALLSGNNTYTFNVMPRATKIDVRRAIEDIYGVDVVSVNVSSIPTKKVRRRSGIGTKGGGKKAMVTLKEGQTIEFM